MANPYNVLIVDDDLDHLQIYGWILKQAGFTAIPCLVRRSGVELPQDSQVDLVILDYVLHCDLASPEVARLIKSTYADAPIVLLSDLDGPPHDVAPFVAQFVRKGEPQRLVDTVSRLLEAQQ